MSTMNNFKLVNPLILGNVETKFSGKNANDVAKSAWNAISQHVTGNVPRFGFTLQRGGDNKLFHYMVKEKVTPNKSVEFSIEQLDVKLTKNQEQKFVDHISKLGRNISKQIGGKNKKDEDDDSSSSSTSTEEIYNKLSLYKSTNAPITYWWYSPMVYTIYGTKYSSIYIPTFTVASPYIEVDVSSAFFA